MTPERDWRAFLDRLAPPALPPCPSGRLVVVAPHPDDEVLASGGLIAMHAARGGVVVVVAVTDGAASHPGDPDWPPARLAEARRHESVDGLRALGLAVGAVERPGVPGAAVASRVGRCGAPDIAAAAVVERLGLPDGAVASCADRLAEAVAARLRPGDRVVTTWRGDGHPDHEATGAAVLRAAAAAGVECLEAPVWLWHHRVPGDPAVPWAALRRLALDPAARESKRLALAAHRTQHAPRVDGAGPVLDAAILARAAWPDEFFFVGEAP